MILKDLITDVLDAADGTEIGKFVSKKNPSIKSITRANKDLTMTFPVMVSNTVDPVSAQLVARALERKFVTLTQMLLSAISITSSKDAIDHLKNVHANLDLSSFFDVDDYLAVSEEATAMHIFDADTVKAVYEAFRQERLRAKPLNHLHEFLSKDVTDAIAKQPGVANNLAVKQWNNLSDDDKARVMRHYNSPTVTQNKDYERRLRAADQEKNRLTSNFAKSRTMQNRKMNKYTLREKIEKNLEILNNGLVGKEKVMKLGLLSILSGENMILVGPPGTAKSEISRRLREILADTDSETYFEYLFTKFTTPEEIFGPLSIKQLQNDKFERNTEGYMPSSRIVFLDEIFKANSSILNTLLTILNERVFHNGLKREKTPLISLIGASNELPFENDELTALYDRFLIRAVVGYVSDDEIEMLLDIKETDMEIPAEIKFTESDLNEIRNESEKVRVTSGIKKTIMQIRQDYNKIFAEDNHEIISDRKLVKMVKLLKISAYLNGRDKVDFSDLMLLINCLWNNPENIEKVTKLVLEAVKRNVAKDEE